MSYQPTTYVQQIEESGADWFWTGTLAPIEDIFSINGHDELVEEGRIMDYDCALLIAQAMDDEAPGQ